jgi:CMP-N-acetylneuraminic acid synthetase
MQLNRLLVISARAGSKRIKNKNFKLFRGKPIIEYSIKIALKSRLFDKIVVSTDNLSKKKFLSKFDIQFSLRPKKISDDKSTIEDVLRYEKEKFKKKDITFNEIWNLAPCSPLISHNDLIAASKLLLKNENNIVLPISKYSAPVKWAFKRNYKGLLKPIFKNNYKLRSQDLTQCYHDIGNFVGIPISFFKKKKIDFDKNYIGLIIPKIQAIDIDDIEDWKIAEALYEKKKT